MVFYVEVLNAFQKQKVKYLIVGGIAMNLLGSMRATSDLDILVEMSNENLENIVRILKKLGYKVKQPVDPMKIADESIRKDWIKNKHMKAFNFYKDEEFKEVDIIIESPVSYDDAKNNIVKIKVGKQIIQVISIDNLIKMKKKTNRAVDKMDINELKRIKRLKKL